jgi:hypothetical protein
MADKVLHDAYQVGFEVVTYHSVSESNKSYHCLPKAHKGKAVLDVESLEELAEQE